MPGVIDNSIDLDNISYVDIKAVIYDLRKKEEWGKFMITTAGNGEVDTALGEECEPNRYPPIDVTYDENISGSYADQAYPDSSYTAVKTPNIKVSWIAANTILDESGDTDRPTEYMTEGYYTCSSAAFLLEYDGCGDGVPSNGPPDSSAY